jgi:hypothetical protein
MANTVSQSGIKFRERKVLMKTEKQINPKAHHRLVREIRHPRFKRDKRQKNRGSKTPSVNWANYIKEIYNNMEAKACISSVSNIFHRRDNTRNSKISKRLGFGLGVCWAFVPEHQRLEN